MELEAGSVAPVFSMASTCGTIASPDAAGGTKLVLFFYPKDDTSGCTREAQDFSRLQGEFAAAGAAVVGVSTGTLDGKTAFGRRRAITVPLAADEDGSLSRAFGVWVEKSMYGRRFMGVERATFLIGLDGRIARVWRRVSVPGHADAVLAAVRVEG